MRLVVTIIGLFLLISCHVEEKKHGLKEGCIEYSMKYLEKDNTSLANLLPKRMIIRFKDDNTISKIESFSGIISFTGITDKKNNRYTTLIKLMNKKFRYEESLADETFYSQKYSKMEIDITEESKTIAGFSCKKAVARFPGTTESPFEIYFTKDIDIDAPNKNTPFHQIDGVLLEFQIKLYNHNVRLTADLVQQKEISKEEFDIPSDYKQVNRKEMEEIASLFH